STSSRHESRLRIEGSDGVRRSRGLLRSHLPPRQVGVGNRGFLPRVSHFQTSQEGRGYRAEEEFRHVDGHGEGGRTGDADGATIIAGGPTEHKVLARFIKGLKQFAKKEFEKFSDDDKQLLGSLDEYVEHKLFIQPALKDVKQKKADFLQSHLTRKQFAVNVMSKGSSIMLRWDMDPSYEKMEELMKTPKYEEELRKWDENGRVGILSVHVDCQTNEVNFSNLKINE
ncbi:hypothetical protein PMAYCL1PPCAC_18989, partial [Pristionchus mayeri]